MTRLEPTRPPNSSPFSANEAPHSYSIQVFLIFTQITSQSGIYDVIFSQKCIFYAHSDQNIAESLHQINLCKKPQKTDSGWSYRQTDKHLDSVDYTTWADARRPIVIYAQYLSLSTTLVFLILRGGGYLPVFRFLAPQDHSDMNPSPFYEKKKLTSQNFSKLS